MRSPVRHALLISVVYFAVACSESDVHPGAASGAIPELVLEETVRIGSVDDPVLGFTRITDVWVSPQDEVWVSDAGAHEIRVYSTTGRLLRSYGREGDGPGEFKSIHSFGLVGDTLWVSDGSIGRTTLFSLDGEVLETVTALVVVPVAEDPRGFPITIRVFPHALRADGLVDSTFVGTVRPNLTPSTAAVPRLAFNLRGEVVDTLGTVETTGSVPVDPGVARSPRHESRWAPHPRRAGAPDRAGHIVSSAPNRASSRRHNVR